MKAIAVSALNFRRNFFMLIMLICIFSVKRLLLLHYNNNIIIMVIKPTETCLDGMQHNAWKKTCQNTRLILATLLKRLTNIITGNQNSGLVREYSSEQPLAGRSLYSWRSHGGKYWRFLAGSPIILQTPRKDKFYAKYVCTQHGKGNLNKTENTKTTTITAWKLGVQYQQKFESPPISDQNLLSQSMYLYKVL